jgi:site-specific DNA recombinase
VHEIFELYVNGINAPRIGMKEIAKRLNEQGSRMRGGLWRIQVIQQILSSTTYAGWHIFNKLDSKTRQIKAESEWVKIPVPVIIGQDLFEQATKLRQANTPKMCAPRRETSPNLLTGLLKCDCCNSTMVLQTAKSGQYRYYKCSARLSKGNTACKSKSYPMEKLDNLVLEAFKRQIYTADYIRAVIDDLRKHASQHGGEDKARLKKLEIELKELEQGENKLFEAVEKGILELDDRLKVRVQQHKTRRESLEREQAALQTKAQTPLQSLTPQKIEAVARVLNKRFSTSTPFSRAYLKATVSEIRISGDLLKLTGENKTMADLVASNGQIGADGKVLGFIPEWRPLRPFDHDLRASANVQFN